MAPSTTTLKRTPLHSRHVALGAKMIAFAGWEMPLQFTSIVEEHRAVRERAGLFDISHMGEIIVAGPRAESVLNRLLTNDVRRLAPGQAQYTLMCNAQGGVMDDLIVYRLQPTVFLLVVNAARVETDFVWMNAHADKEVVLENASDRYAALALQGPHATHLLPEAADLAPFHIASRTVAGHACHVARTGYTGEDGFELLCEPAAAEPLWETLCGRGAVPCGLGARDTLRLEMCYPLYGQDLTEQTTPIEAGLRRFVCFEKEFIGRDALQRPPARKLVAFRMEL
ncbi:MAG: glycine cleavage system aminomethyltransferase GcvT, partial [Verrucomicrobiae bacterium]|nr:glycine cleavage system aminomethyltransferase GcvT [Verrucomicrobiae bacterium]